MITREYPKGAIKNVLELLQGVDLRHGSKTTLYEVMAFPERSTASVVEETVQAPLIFHDPLNNGSLFLRVRNVAYNYMHDISLQDRNIMPNNYNHHFAFFNREDAEAYADSVAAKYEIIIRRVT